MTPPDSGERCNATHGEDRVVYQCSRPKGHTGQHRDGNVTAWDQKPDSGERARLQPNCRGSYDSSQREWRVGPFGVDPFAAHEPRTVSLPLPLAQRILAALTGSEPLASWRERDALAAELRAAVGRKP